MKPSQTAQFAAAHRAYHLTHARPPILEDTAAGWLLGPPLSTVLRFAPLRWLFWRPLIEEGGSHQRLHRGPQPVRGRRLASRPSVTAAARWSSLGAGLDSWALRHSEPGVTVFELDQPATQEWKLARIRSRLGRLPADLVPVPIDLERESVADVLPAHGFDRRGLAFVSWLGTIPYLTRSSHRGRPSPRWPRSARRAAGSPSTTFSPRRRCRPRT